MWPFLGKETTNNEVENNKIYKNKCFKIHIHVLLPCDIHVWLVIVKVSQVFLQLFSWISKLKIWRDEKIMFFLL